MKTPSFRTLFLALGSIALAFNSSAKVFDGGVDSANLGKGDWIYYISQATNQLGGNVPSVTDIPSFMSYEKSQGMKWIVVKMGTGSTNFNGGGSTPQFNEALIDEAHKVGLQIFGYTRSYGDDIPGEVAMAANCYNMGADGFIFDAESEWESGHQGTLGPTNAWKMLSEVKTNFPTKFLGHAPFPYISLHSSFPYKEFGYWCDAAMPQDYWVSFAKPPSQVVSEVDVEWRNWHNSLSGQWTNSIKPIAPIGQCDTATMPASDIPAFVDALRNLQSPASYGGYRGLSWWRADLHEAVHWTAIATNTLGNAMGTVNDIVVDNPLAAVTGTWTTGTSSTDKFGTDYRNKTGGTGAAFVTFKPGIWTKGNYQISEWHPQGSNRTTNAPHVIAYNGGSTTNFINQQINGGRWNLLGTFNMKAGVGNYVRIADNFSDSTQNVMADAIKLAYVVPANGPVNAPTSLAVAAVDGTHLQLTWTDNSTTEEWFVIGRSTTSGGPYTDIGIAGQNATNFVDSLLTSGTTYYYVVRAANAGGSSTNSLQASGTTTFEIVIDNPSATVVGTWSSGTGSADKFGSDYRFKNGGTGAAYLQYTPNITTPGNYDIYEWHPQGANRTVAAPFTITYNGGSTTVTLNQQINGGKWNLLGTFNLASGTVGNVRISDNFADSANVVMADAVKFVFAGAPPVNPPAAPSGLTATTISSSQINLAWTDNSTDEDNFIVARSTTSGGPYTDIATLGANITSHSDTGLTAGTTYFYVVRASNAGGSSANSAQASATTSQTIPNAPSGLTATAVSQTQINLSWTDNSSNESNFIIGRSTTSGGPYTDIATLGANVTSFNNTGLAAGTTYFYVVRASNAAGSSANSAQASATTLPAAPAAPGGLTATAVSSSQINLAWTDNSANETSFIVARSTTLGGPYTDIATLGADVTSYSNTGLAANTTYYYVVRASNSGGNSANSNEASATTPETLPTAPGGMSATAVSGSQINLAWTDNSFNETSFIVARGTTTGGPYTDIATLGANVTSYSDMTVVAGTTYFYVVRASNSAGSSPNSNEASATPPVLPTAPGGLTATPVRATQINLAWTDNSSNESSFIVGRSTTAGGPYTDIATLAANTTTYNDTSVTPNTTYFYVVRAHNTSGDSANSNEDSASSYETDLLIDNRSATVVGSWSTGSGSTDKYGTDYRFSGQGTGANYLQFTPFITTAGMYEVYEWHPQGANRTTNAPVVVNYNGGSTTVRVNQEINGGTWVLIGTFNFAAGSSGNIRITDNFTDAATGQVVLADAIKLVAAPPPTAPSGLTATAVSGSQINLAWTDNSSNETGFIVARSTTSGGPYTDVAGLVANSTSYSDTGLAPNTTYFYVVRATGTGGNSANSAQASATTFKKVHVNSITMTWVASGSKFKSQASVNVKDSAGVNVASATVTGNFTGAFSNTGLSGVTGSGGNATIVSTSAISRGTVTFTVTNISGASLQYDSAANVVSSATATR